MICAPDRIARTAALALGLALGCTTARGQAPADDMALASRGEYLARAADCLPCHTGDKSKPYSGGLPIKTPFGTIFSVNITSDPETGIGRWAYADFKNALHNGIRADGAFLYPAMPFDTYTGIEEDDLKALWAFVHRIPSVKAPNRENELAFPFNIRMGMLAWRELFFAPAFFKPTAGKSSPWNRGAYLAEALGHCSDCHSPRNIMGAIKGKAQFTGTEIDGFYAPDIASGALAKTWNKDSLAQFLKTGSVPQRTAVLGPMAEVVHDSLAYLTATDLGDMVSYLLDSAPPPDMPAPQKLSPLRRPGSLRTQSAGRSGPRGDDPGRRSKNSGFGRNLPERGCERRPGRGGGRTDGRLLPGRSSKRCADLSETGGTTEFRDAGRGGLLAADGGHLCSAA